jgi:hypothetical protein
MTHAELGPNFLVIGDVHGERELTEKAIQLADDYGATPVFLGDVIHGPDTKGTIDTIMALGSRAVTVAGNHEWILRNALFSPAIEASTEVRDLAWPNKPKLLKSYGLEHKNRETDALNLRAAMEDAGHWDWLESLPPFFETDTFIAIHSGPLPDVPWSDQREQLLRASLPESRLHEAPKQILDEAHKLSGVNDTPEEVDERIFVTGHRHTFLRASERRARNRVVLASKVTAGQPLYAWESIVNHIHEIRAA